MSTGSSGEVRPALTSSRKRGPQAISGLHSQAALTVPPEIIGMRNSWFMVHKLLNEAGYPLAPALVSFDSCILAYFGDLHTLYLMGDCTIHYRVPCIHHTQERRCATVAQHGKRHNRAAGCGAPEAVSLPQCKTRTGAPSATNPGAIRASATTSARHA